MVENIVRKARGFLVTAFPSIPSGISEPLDKDT